MVTGNQPEAVDPAVAWLGSLGAAGIEHPGGTLLAHLERVRAMLAAWGARPELQSAGLCHAAYGTDGFAVALLAPQGPGRAELVRRIGPAAEEIVYRYASCDRKASYAALPRADGAFHDRFTGTAFVPSPAQRRDFAELTVANELDLLLISPEIRARWGEALGRLFTSLRPLLSAPAWHAVTQALGDPPDRPQERR
ncbi:hypothetical protein OG500_09775 [Kitasatospora sp. NBC_01250]|uniref:DUF6817 domain-containing protein n=1 Tax=unclassified Kitasatospora TaxID=2633591 RepID=UPI002E0D2365|nr:MULTISPECIES: hypothetical protein [unclassified Kitasatospora]WSJ66454.1 hypothetical protein OG294_10135 [Kitasatospora sp. NBC_01302]